MKMNYEVYQDGVDARYAKKALMENPHPENTSEHYDWYEGWTDAEQEARDHEYVTNARSKNVQWSYE